MQEIYKFMHDKDCTVIDQNPKNRAVSTRRLQEQRCGKQYMKIGMSGCLLLW